jgi:polyisoprenoid-binding protein YceI
MTLWRLDSKHSSISFSARHMMVGTVRGSFHIFRLDVEFDPLHPEMGHVKAVVQAATIDTGDVQRDTHLRSEEFLAAEQFPTILFTSTHVDKRGDGAFGLHGDLTIRGGTRPVVLDVTYVGDVANPQGGRSAGLTARGRINRSEFGLMWNVSLEAGGVLVSDEVQIEIEIELVQAAAKTPDLAARAVVITA